MYDLFAPYYDEVMNGGGNAAVDVTQIKDWIALYQPDGNHLLELACGTGSILQEFAGAYALSGLDLSAGMIAQARRKLPAADLRVGDMADFTFDTRFDVILCLFDSLNHVLEFDGWRAVFARASAHLEPGGLFIFDINTAGRHRELHDEPPTTWQDGQTTVTLDGQPGVSALTDWHVTVDQPGAGGHIVTTHEIISENAFALSDVWAAASEEFEILACISADGEPVSDDSERVYFMCRAAEMSQ